MLGRAVYTTSRPPLDGPDELNEANCALEASRTATDDD